MDAGSNAKLVGHGKENGIHGQDIAVKYASYHDAVYAARLRVDATGEPYVEQPKASQRQQQRTQNSKCSSQQ